jgi:hypothetical protein
MHYRNGREAKVGDKVIGKDCSGNPVGGILTSTNAGSTTCNGYVVPMSIIEVNHRIVTLGDCLHVDDFAEQPKSEKAE